MKGMRFLVAFAFLLTAAVASAQPTYTREVSRILQGKCQQCHRPGDIAPMELSTYEQAVDWAQDIKRVVNEGLMPPWKPVEGHGKFRDGFGLTTQEKQDLIAWVDGGTPKGIDSDMPEALPERGEWVLGDPDKIVQMPEAFTPVRGKDVYRCFVIDPQNDEDKYVSAIDVVPGNRKSVHHVILYLDSTGEAEKLDEKEEGPGYTCYGGPGTPIINSNNLNLDALSFTLGGWAPGARPHHLPTGTGMFLGKRAKIVMQVHYYTTVSLEPDQTRVGLYYSKADIEKRLFFLPMIQTRLNIPPNNSSFKVTSDFTIPFLLDAKVVNIFPHMHLLGTDIKVESTRAGKTESMIWIDKWDFNWQGAYSYEEPASLSAGTRVRLTCTYDNSANNPRNPSNPPKLVQWGEGTEDEMCIAFMGVTFDRQSVLGLQPVK
jgi:Copper type II ascorbate-dependent monooxygenase, N-terminal domain/Copper type II ascorbate-dependent monooxygenase, C-terminal domain